MKKNYLLLFIISLCLNSITQAQFSWVKQWDHRYGGVDGDYVIAFEKTKHNGYILAGKTTSDSSGNKLTHMFGTGAFDYWVIKVDSLGLLKWERSYKGSDNDVLWGLDVTSDGGYIIGGTSDSPIGGDKSQASRGGTDYWIIKLDSMGNKVWDQTYGGADDEDLHSIIQTADGGYLIGGDSRSGITGDKTEAKFGINDYWVVKTDALGFKQWDKVYGGPGYEKYRASVQTVDHGFIHAGQSSSGVGGNKTDASQGGIDYWLVKTDSAGTIQWDSAYGGNGDDNLQTINATVGGGYICGGWSTSGVSGDKSQPNHGAYDIWILRINSVGTIQWEKTYGGLGLEDEFSCIYQMSDGGYLLGATSYSNSGGDKTDNNLGVEQPWILKVDSVGNKIWDKTVFTLGHNELGLIKETSERNCYVVVSGENGLIGGDKSEDAWGGFSSDYWIVKYCKGEILETEELTIQKEDLLVYPSPFSDELTIHLFGKSNAATATVVVYDLLGKRVFSKQFNSETTLSTTSLLKGIYFLEVNVNGKLGRKKIVK